jgi:hypothetical protein
MLPPFSNGGTCKYVLFAINESRRKSLNVWATSPLCNSHAEQYETILLFSPLFIESGGLPFRVLARWGLALVIAGGQLQRVLHFFCIEQPQSRPAKGICTTSSCVRLGD